MAITFCSVEFGLLSSWGFWWEWTKRFSCRDAPPLSSIGLGQILKALGWPADLWMCSWFLSKRMLKKWFNDAKAPKMMLKIFWLRISWGESRNRDENSKRWVGRESLTEKKRVTETQEALRCHSCPLCSQLQRLPTVCYLLSQVSYLFIAICGSALQNFCSQWPSTMRHRWRDCSLVQK